MKSIKYTGAKYKCSGLEEDLYQFWKKYFTIGKKYFEAKPPNTETRHLLNDDNILLVDNDGHLIIVEASQFEKMT